MPHVELEFSVPHKYQEEILKNLYWIHPGLEKIAFDPTNDRRLEFAYKGTEPTEKLGGLLKEVANRLAKSLALVPPKVIFTSDVQKVRGCQSPYEKLCEKKWVIPVSSGTHVYFGLMNELYQALEGRFRRLALRTGAIEGKFPTLLSLETLRKSGYLEGFPHNANYVCHLSEHIEIIETFKAEMKKTGKMPSVSFDKMLVLPSHGLSPTVCYPFFQSLEGDVLKNPIAGVTALSPCFRYEGKAMEGLRRLCEFNMREIIFVGEPTEVLERRDLLLKVQKEMLQFCNLQSSIQTASDPFFFDNYDRHRVFQLSFELKYEVEAYLPEDDAWLAIGSVNYHQDHFGKSFNIKLASGQFAHSCCLGFGIDRWCMVIFAQYGIDINHWPVELREMIKAYRAEISDTPKTNE